MTKKSTESVAQAPASVQETMSTAGVKGVKLTKMELIAEVCFQTKLTKVQSAAVVNTLLNLLIEALKRGQEVSLVELGTFSVKAKAARTGMNPSTNERMQIPAGKRVAFKASPALKSGL